MPQDDDKIAMALRHLTAAVALLNSVKPVKPKTPPTPKEPLSPSHKFARLVSRDAWPSAVPDSLILDPHSDRDRQKRAKMILDRKLERSVAGKRFLDLSCGLGDLAYAVLQHNPDISIGYAPDPGGWGRFPETPNLKYTTDTTTVKENGKYDAIFLWNQVQNLLPDLKLAREVLAYRGLVYVRVTPWSSRCAGLPVLNKAFAHIYLGEEGLASYGMRRPNRPILGRECEEWFRDAGLKIRTARPVKHPVEPLFKTPALSQPLLDLFGVRDFPEDDLSLSHIDYTLEAL